VNLILFETAETTVPLRRTDPRAIHLLEVLRRRAGDTFDAGLVDGPRGKGTLIAIAPDTLTLAFAWGDAPPPPSPFTMIIGLPRPQTARKILQEATALGVAALHFVSTEKGEPNYAQSTLWRDGEWRRHLVAGTEQAFCTRLPEVTFTHPLDATVDRLPPGGTRIALDNYESPQALSALALTAPITLAFGPERGWSAREREFLRAQNFQFGHLGARVLRTETAIVASLAIAKAKLGEL
jgi:16S rRNA (uracil1498-N3)-methyltransferase